MKLAFQNQQIERSTDRETRPSATEILLPGRQMRPMYPPGDPRSHPRWSIWRPTNSSGFAQNISEWNRRYDSTDALIIRIHLYLCLNKTRIPIGSFWPFFNWFQGQIIDWRTTQNWDGSPNHQPWVVRLMNQDFPFSAALQTLGPYRYRRHVFQSHHQWRPICSPLLFFNWLISLHCMTGHLCASR